MLIIFIAKCHLGIGKRFLKKIKVPVIEKVVLIDTCFNFLFLVSVAQVKQDKLLMKLEKLKFLNGPSTVYKESRFVYLKQCGLYVEEYNVSKVRKSDLQHYICCLQVTFTKRRPFCKAEESYSLLTCQSLLDMLGRGYKYIVPAVLCIIARESEGSEFFLFLGKVPPASWYS